MHDAVTRKNDAMVELLLRHSAEVALCNKKGLNVLHYAALRGNMKITKLLLRHLGSGYYLIDEKKEDGFTALHLAALNGHTECVRLLIEDGGASVDVQNERRQTALHLAIERNQAPIVRLLLSCGCSANIVDQDGDTPLHEALRYYTLTQLKQLKETQDFSQLIIGLPASKKLDEKKSTASMAQMLVQYGAELGIKNRKGQTPLDLCPDPNLQRVLKEVYEQRQAELARTEQEPVLFGAVARSSGAAAAAGPLAIRDEQHAPLASSMIASQASTGFPPIAPPATGPASFSRPLLRQFADALPSALPPPPTVPPPSLPPIPPPRAGVGASTSRMSPLAATAVATTLSTATSEALECLVCSDQTRSVLFRPCGHVVACSSCASRVKKCLLCKSAVVDRARIEECVVCSERRADVLFRPCCHLVVCDNCSLLMRRCVECRAQIEERTPLAVCCRLETSDNAATRQDAVEPSFGSNVPPQTSSSGSAKPISFVGSAASGAISAAANLAPSGFSATTRQVATAFSSSSESGGSVAINNSLVGSASVAGGTSGFAGSRAPLSAPCNSALVERLTNDLSSGISLETPEDAEGASQDMATGLPASPLAELSQRTVAGEAGDGTVLPLPGAPSVAAPPGDYSKMKQQLDEYRELTVCPVCLDRRRNMIFLCGHGTCQQCGDRLKECPICRKAIKDKILVF